MEYRVLIVEDDRVIADVIAGQLSKWGLSTEIIEDFQRVTAQFARFDPQLVYGHDFDSVRMRIISDKIDKEIDIYYSNYDWYNKYYSTFQLMNFLRVIQYAKEERTVAFLKNVLNSIL